MSKICGLIFGLKRLEKALRNVCGREVYCSFGGGIWHEIEEAFCNYAFEGERLPPFYFLVAFNDVSKCLSQIGSLFHIPKRR